MMSEPPDTDLDRLVQSAGCAISWESAAGTRIHVTGVQLKPSLRRPMQLHITQSLAVLALFSSLVSQLAMGGGALEHGAYARH